MLRQYLPPLLISAFLLSILTQLGGKKRAALLIAAGAVLIFFAPWETEHVDYFEFKFPLWDSIRFLLMPQFWNVEPEREGFIFVPSIFHWLLFLPMLYGGFRLWCDVPRARILFIYFTIMVLFYSIVPELQGTRQRFQLVFLTAWMQFHAVWILLPKRAAGAGYGLDHFKPGNSLLQPEQSVAVAG